MSRPKTSKVRHFSVQFNPETSEEDRVTLEIIEELEAQRWKFKQIIQDAVLRARGYTPEMFSQTQGPHILGGIESLLERFANELLGEFRKGGGLPAEETQGTDEAGMSPFGKNFVKSFMQHQGQSEDED